MNKPTVVERPKNASEQVVRLLVEDVVKAIKQERAKHKDRIVVTVE
jgi:hypothetical protein